MVEKSYRFLGIIVFIALFLFIFSASFVNSDYDLGENETYGFLKDKYGPEESVDGWFNISFDDEPVTSFFIYKNKNISLYDLFNKNSSIDLKGYNYTCDFPGCEPSYASVGQGKEEVSFEIHRNASNIFGVEINGDITNIGSAEFDLSSDASSSCSNQIEIDLFADGSLDFINTNRGSGTCGKNYGCFNTSKSSSNLLINENTPIYCQKINLSRSPGVKLGAWVKNKSGSVDLRMSLYNDNREVGDCALPSPSDAGGEISCSVNYSLRKKEKPYTVCIWASEGLSSNDEVYVKGYGGGEKCGSPKNPPIESPGAAYRIFAIEEKFGNVETFTIGDEISSEKFLSDEILDYLENKYGDLDCSSHECIVPIEIISRVNNQNIIANNLDLDVETKDIGTSEITNFYDIEVTPAKVSSDFQKLYFDEWGLPAEEDTGNFTFEIMFNGEGGEEEILSEELTVIEVPEITSFEPKETATVISTNFEIKVDAAGNITEYFWDFGDNETKTTTEKNVSHIYERSGNYTVKVNVTDQYGRETSRDFDIKVSTSKEIIETTLDSKINKAEEFESSLEKYGFFKTEVLEKYTGFKESKKTLDEINLNYTGDNPEEEMNKLAKKLIEVRIPSQINKIDYNEQGILSYPVKENIEPGVVSSITGGNYSHEDRSQYISKIEDWNIVNVENSVSYEKFTIKGGEEDFASFFSILLDKKASSTIGDYFFIIKDIENMEFDGSNASKVQGEDYRFLKLSGDKTITFATTENIDFDKIPYFISPELSEFSIDYTQETPSEEALWEKKWFWYVAGSIVLAIIGFVGYYFLQRWYDKKYEDSLFKDKNKLYNLANFVTKAKQQGKSDKEIKKSLKKANWSGEQIRYIMKKYAGERTGLPKLFGGLFGGKDKKPKKPRRRPGPNQKPKKRFINERK